MATYSTISIINYALVLCGANTVAAITDDTPNARPLNTMFDFSRKSFETENMWTFSTTRSTLSTVSTTSFPWLADEESYVYTRPTNCLKIWALSDPAATFREEGDWFYSDTADLGARWTFDQTDYTKWQPAAIDSFCYKLASEIAFQIMNDIKKSVTLKDYYMKSALPNALAQNSQIGLQQQVIDGAWLSSKYHNGSGGDPSRSYG